MAAMTMGEMMGDKTLVSWGGGRREGGKRSSLVAVMHSQPLLTHSSQLPSLTQYRVHETGYRQRAALSHPQEPPVAEREQYMSQYVDTHSDLNLEAYSRKWVRPECGAQHS